MVVWTSYHDRLSICLAASARGLCRLSLASERSFERELKAQFGEAAWSDRDPVLSRAVAQVKRYFAGTLREFDIPLDLRGTNFQKAVWQGLREIPYGETCSYADLGERVARSRNMGRAIGQANHNNPVAIVVPCHRVIAADGTLGGYGGGLETKKLLLNLEGAAYRSTPESQARFQIRSVSRARRAAAAQ